MPPQAPISAETVLCALRSSPHQAALVAELGAPESLLADLERSGDVAIQERSWPDPCLDGVDLRIGALVESGDRQRALAAIESIWQRWLADYLNQHRCC